MQNHSKPSVYSQELPQLWLRLQISFWQCLSTLPFRRHWTPKVGEEMTGQQTLGTHASQGMGLLKSRLTLKQQNQFLWFVYQMMFSTRATLQYKSSLKHWTCSRYCGYRCPGCIGNRASVVTALFRSYQLFMGLLCLLEVWVACFLIFHICINSTLHLSLHQVLGHIVSTAGTDDLMHGKIALVAAALINVEKPKLKLLGGQWIVSLHFLVISILDCYHYHTMKCEKCFGPLLCRRKFPLLLGGSPLRCDGRRG